MKRLSRFKVLPLIKENKYFECNFIKKDNTVRNMKCTYEDNKEHLEYVIVYDTENNSYRNVNISTLITLKIKDIIYKIV